MLNRKFTKLSDMAAWVAAAGVIALSGFTSGAAALTGGATKGPVMRGILASALVCLLAAISADAALAQGPERAATPANAKTRVFVDADDSAHKQALIAIADRGLRHEYLAPGNELTFSAELTAGQIRAMERLGAYIESVPLAEPLAQERRYGALRKRTIPAGKPVCGDGICQGNEKSSCPADCGAPPPPTTSDRTCEPQDQREYQTLLLSGAGTGGGGVKLLIVDSGVDKEHLDLDVTFCRDATGRRIRNKCNDQLGHGTGTAGAAAANGGADELGLFGTAPNAILGVAKFCGANFCFVDDMVRAIEDGVDTWHPDVISISFGTTQLVASLENAIQHAVDDGALVVVSAGNSGPNENTVRYPATDPNTVAVSMLDAAGIANSMTSRGDDVELVGGGFVTETTSASGCYGITSGTSYSAPSVAGFAAAHWQGSASDTRDYMSDLPPLGVAVDIDNTGLTQGYDDTDSGFDTSTGYGMPQDGAGTNGSPGATVAATPGSVAIGDTVGIAIEGPAQVEANYRIGVSSPKGDWTFAQFVTDSDGTDSLTLTPWADPGIWLLTVDFGGGATDFAADFDTFEQTP